MLFYSPLETPKGWVLAVASEGGLVSLNLPQKSRSEALKQSRVDLSAAKLSPDLFLSLSERLTRYFKGEQVQFPDPLDFTGASSFQQGVWEATRRIPYGETRSYGWVAEQIGSPTASRAVGRALGVNPLCIVVPCHRVVGVRGGLCGFAGGLPMKEWLLGLEQLQLDVAGSLQAIDEE